MLRLKDRTSVHLSWGGLLADFTLLFAPGGAFGCWTHIFAMLAFLLSFLCMQECLARLSRKIEEPSLLRRARRIEAVTLSNGLLFALTAFTSSYFLIVLMPIVALVVIVATCTQFLLVSKALEQIGGEDSPAGLLTPNP